MSNNPVGHFRLSNNPVIQWRRRHFYLPILQNPGRKDASFLPPGYHIFARSPRNLESPGYRVALLEAMAQNSGIRTKTNSNRGQIYCPVPGAYLFQWTASEEDPRIPPKTLTCAGAKFSTSAQKSPPEISFSRPRAYQECGRARALSGQCVAQRNTGLTMQCNTT